MPFNLRLLRVFLAVAREGSITRGAVEVGLTQPAVSRAIRELETQVRATLLERTPQGVRLTEAGTALLGHARVIFAEARAAEEDLEALAGLAQGTLRVGGSPTIATFMLPPLLAAFHSTYPGIELTLTSAPSRDVARKMVERDIDVALVETPVENPRLVGTVWARDELVLVAAPGHPLLDRTPVPPAALAHELLVIREPGSGTFVTIMRALRARGIVPHRRLEVDTAEAIVQLASAGVGVAIVSRCAAADALALGKLAIAEVAGLQIRRPFLRLSLLGGGETASARAFSAVLEAKARRSGASRPRKSGGRAVAAIAS